MITGSQGCEKKFRPNLQGKCVSAPPRVLGGGHPQPEQESIFRTVSTWCLKFGDIFRYI